MAHAIRSKASSRGEQQGRAAGGRDGRLIRARPPRSLEASRTAGFQMLDSRAAPPPALVKSAGRTVARRGSTTSVASACIANAAYAISGPAHAKSRAGLGRSDGGLSCSSPIPVAASASQAVSRVGNVPTPGQHLQKPPPRGRSAVAASPHLWRPSPHSQPRYRVLYPLCQAGVPRRAVPDACPRAGASCRASPG